MEMKYAGSEVLQMAVEIEKKGKAFYDEVVKTVKDERTREVFQFLADEEVKHEEIFKKMLKEVEVKREVSPYSDTDVILYFRSLVGQKIFPSEKEAELMKKELSESWVAILISLSLEKDSVLFYHEMLPVSQEKDHEVIKRIIDEERNHIHRILQLESELQVEDNNLGGGEDDS